MNITTKIIITDTNIITDLCNANILDKFVNLDNVYISDLIKNDEIKESTGNIDIINKFKEIPYSSEQFKEMFQILEKTNGLSRYDIINYILARDNNAILATGDQKLKNYSEKNGIEVIRTLKIIKLMEKNKIISIDEAINACILLKNNKSTRIPLEEINKYLLELKSNSVTC